MVTNFAKKKADRPERPEPDINPVVALKKAVGEREEEIEISRITIDQSLQVRSKGLDAPTVERYRVVIQNGGELPPITLYRVQTDDAQSANIYLLAAGFHRIEAHKLEGRPTIFAVIRQGTREDAMIEAARSNLAHGLDLKVPDLRRALEILLVAGYYLRDGVLASNAVIAGDLGVSAETVSVWAKEISTLRNLRVDFTRRWGKDGKTRDVENIQEAATKRAEEQRERRATEEAERKRNLPAVEKIRIVTQYLIAKYRDDRAKRHTPLMDDPKRGFEWCFQVSNPASFAVDIDWERQFLHEYGAKPVNVYREFLRLADREVFTRADMDGWTDAQLEEWVREMGRRPPRQPNAGTFQQTGMAQPKNPDLQIPQPRVLGRHRPNEAAATEMEVSEEIPPCPYQVGERVMIIKSGSIVKVLHTKWVNDGWRIDTERGQGFLRLDEIAPVSADTETPTEPSLDDCPFSVGQELWVVETGELDTVMKITWEDGEWRIWMENGEDFNRVEELSDIHPSSMWDAGNAAEDAAVDEALEHSLQAMDEASRHLEYDEPYDRPAPLFHIGQFMESTEGLLGQITAMEPDADGRWWYEIDDDWYAEKEMRPANSPQLKNPPATVYDAPNGKRQAETMVEDARTIIPRLLLESINATVDYRMTTLVRWESQKDIQTILETADDKELRRLLREAEHAITEFTTAQKGIQTAVNRCQGIVRQIQELKD